MINCLLLVIAVTLLGVYRQERSVIVQIVMGIAILMAIFHDYLIAMALIKYMKEEKK